ncbi:MAG TPA: hypothetical protein VFQ90_03285 [Stellaceae bacterium]|nr:hypothetical protein [Stellaceae bacterium]
MRGDDQIYGKLFSYIDLEKRVSAGASAAADSFSIQAYWNAFAHAFMKEQRQGCPNSLDYMCEDIPDTYGATIAFRDPSVDVLTPAPRDFG